jgi:hypothetical protein
MSTLDGWDVPLPLCEVCRRPLAEHWRGRPCSSKIDLGHGAYLEPDEEPRTSPFHKRIVKTRPIAGTRSGNWLALECGHIVQSFGRLEHAHGVVLCAWCRMICQKSGLSEEEARRKGLIA